MSRTPGVLVIGLGRVGLVSAAVLADAGLRVRAVERDPHRRTQIARGRAPFAEPGLTPLLARLVAAGRLGVDEGPRTLEGIDVALLCVGTPPARTGGFDLTALTGALRELGHALRSAERDRPLLVAVRATVLPGTCETVLIPTLAEAAGTPPGRGWELVHLPEFLREGRALADVRHPARLVVGERLPGAARGLYGLFDPLGLVPRAVPLRLAELLKLADNAWHATKVAFANELGRLARASGVEPAELAELFLADRRLNLGPAYLHPGEPFGGPCLPKDLRALRHYGRRLGLALPLLEGVAASNARHLDWLVAALGARIPPPGPVLLFGLAFKPTTGDPRGSPWLTLARRLLAAGYRLFLYDPELVPGVLDAELAPLWRTPADLPAATVVLATRDDPPADRPVLDLRRLVAVRDAPAPAPCRRCDRRGAR